MMDITLMSPSATVYNGRQEPLTDEVSIRLDAVCFSRWTIVADNVLTVEYQVVLPDEQRTSDASHRSLQEPLTSDVYSAARGKS